MRSPPFRVVLGLALCLGALVFPGCRPSSRSDPVPGPRNTTEGTPNAPPPRIVPSTPNPSLEKQVTCFICGETIPESAAAVVDYRGTSCTFCSERCRRRFLANPEFYLAPPKPAPR